MALRFRHQTTGSDRVDNVNLMWWDPFAMQQTLSFMHSHFDDYSPTVRPFKEIIANYHGSFKKKYIRAKKYIKLFGVEPKHFTVKSFVKDDKYHLKEEFGDGEAKMPRAIQYQSPEGTLFKAQYIKPVEDHFYKMLDVHGLRIFCKGLNNDEIGELFSASNLAIDDPIYIENDFSSFDASICTEMLSIYHKFLIRHVPKEYKKLLHRYLRYDLKLRGYTSAGRPYTTVGTIASGSIDTSFKGNFINYLCTITILNYRGVPPSAYKFLCNGDDSVLFLERKYADVDLGLFEYFGLTSKTVKKDSFNLVEFCQSHPITFGNRTVMVRDPKRSFTRLGWIVRNMGDRANLNYVKTVVMGEMAINFQVPVIYPLLRKIYHSIGGQIDLKHLSSYIREVYTSNINWRKDEPYCGEPEWDDIVRNTFPNFTARAVDIRGPDCDKDDVLYTAMLATYGLVQAVTL